ncbi:hypothetical protein [Luteolibacter marinus]|uniref:hypothetical protein n=1 Tax=Luteolibacter marinus TaxID=2776705 RepID=UPI001868B557|nr:hypothetical protein [Luteolibacter marinus]
MRFLFVLLLGAAPAWSLDSRHTYTTPDELQGFGDFNHDGRLDVIVVERNSGLYRLGSGQPDGSLLWSNARPTGCPGAESLAVGTVTPAVNPVFLVTGRSANQVFLIDPATTYTRPLTISPPGIGPASVAAVDLNLAGNDPALLDLVVSTHWDSPPNPYKRHVFQSLPGGISAAATINTGTSPLERISRVQFDTASAEIFSVTLRGASDTFRLIDATNPGLPVKASLTGLPAGIEFVHSPFLGTALSQFVFFTPGAPGITFSAWSGSSLTGPDAKVIGPDPVRSVHLTDNGTRIGIAVIYNDGSHADLFTFDAAGNPLPEGTVNPPAGETLKGILATAPGRFSALSGPPGASSTTTTPFSHDGSGWIPGAATPLPALEAVTTRANVFLYDKEPVVNADAKLVEALHIPDWTSTFSIGGSPSEMTFSVETFGGESIGLDSAPSTVIPGPLPATNKALLNQNLPEVSVSSTSTSLGVVPLQISIDPPAGTYARHVAPQLVVPDATGISAWFRTDPAAAWSSYTFGTPITPPGDTLQPFTVWFYAEDSSRRSAIQSASYTFSGAPGELDSDGDGVPDFVEIQKGLDPLAGPDSDDDGLSDLEELLLGSDPANGSETASYGGDILDLPPSRTNDEDGDGFSDFDEWASGSNPFDAGSTPTASSLVEYRNTFDLDVRPQSHSGTVATLPDRDSYPEGDPVFSPTEIRVHDLGSFLLGAAPTRDHSSTSTPDIRALVPSLPATGRDLFMIASTPTAFDCEQDSSLPGWGRELIGLVPIPTLDAGAVPFTATAASTADEWITAARTHYAALPHEVVSGSLDLYDTLVYLLWERITGLKLAERGILTGPLPLGLTPFRDTVPGQSQAASTGQLLDLQSYIGPADSGFLLQSIEAAIRSEIQSPTHVRTVALKKLANEIYRISVGLGTSTPGLYPSPFETLRTVIRELPADAGDVDGMIDLPGADAVPPTSYATVHALSATDISRADAALVHLLGLIAPRPVQTFEVTVTGSTFDGPVPVLQDDATLLGLRAYDENRNPFVFPQSFDLPPGTTLEILAFTDRTDLPAGDGTAIEAISAVITGFPEGSPGDTNQNAIPDAYEDYFFGGGVDPFGDADGDGYINLQEALDGTHPNDPASMPAGDPLPAGMPPVEIARAGGNLTFTLTFPSAYGDRIHFLLQDAGGTLSAPFVEMVDAATDAGSDIYSLTIPHPGNTRNFYRFRLALRP